jgi:hypothetical protein
MFERHPSTETCYQSLAAFANDVVAGKAETKMERIDGRGVISGAFDPKGFPEYSKSEVCSPLGPVLKVKLISRMEECVEKRRSRPPAIP